MEYLFCCLHGKDNETEWIHFHIRQLSPPAKIQITNIMSIHTFVTADLLNNTGISLVFTSGWVTAVVTVDNMYRTNADLSPKKSKR